MAAVALGAFSNRGLSAIMALQGGPTDDRDASGGRLTRRLSMQKMLKRAVAVWCLIFVLEVVHGVLRTIWLVPLVGDFRARQVGVLTGSLLILVVAVLTIRWIGIRGRRDLLRVGLLWVVLMVVAEVLLGRVVFGYPWSRIAEDFDVSRGGLLGFGMLMLAAAPWLASAIWGPCSKPSGERTPRSDSALCDMSGRFGGAPAKVRGLHGLHDVPRSLELQLARGCPESAPLC